jgi:hypothetical protein
MNKPVQADLTPEQRRALLARFLRNVEQQAGTLAAAIEKAPAAPAEALIEELPLIAVAATDLFQEVADIRTELHRYRTQLRRLKPRD